MQTLRSRLVAPPAPLAEGEYAIASDASAWGEIGVLVTTEPGLARGFVAGPHHSRFPFYVPPRPCPAALYRYQEPEWHRVQLSGLPVSYPLVALLPADEVLIVCPRTPWVDDREEPRNAHIFGPDGRHLRAFALGDDIHEVVVDDVGTIWTAHGEESWPDTLSLVRWDRYGKRLWDSGLACDDTPVNAHAGIVWAHRNPGSSLIRLQTQKQGFQSGSNLVEYQSPEPEVHAIAFAGDQLLLVGADHQSSLYEVAAVIQRIDTVRFVGPSGATLEDWAILASHGSRLYLHNAGAGYQRVDIAN